MDGGQYGWYLYVFFNVHNVFSYCTGCISLFECGVWVQGEAVVSSTSLACCLALLYPADILCQSASVPWPALVCPCKSGVIINSICSLTRVSQFGW